jgi:hypothetical protein
MVNQGSKSTITESTDCPSIRKLNTFFRRFILLPVLKLSLWNNISRVSKRLTMFFVNKLCRMEVQENFFCFECGMDFAKGEMKQTIADWFGICRLCNAGYDHRTGDQTKFM